MAGNPLPGCRSMPDQDLRRCQPECLSPCQALMHCRVVFRGLEADVLSDRKAYNQRRDLSGEWTEVKWPLGRTLPRGPNARGEGGARHDAQAG